MFTSSLQIIVLAGLAVIGAFVYFAVVLGGRCDDNAQEALKAARGIHPDNIAPKD